MPRHPPSDYLRFIEAAASLTLASMAIRWLPFERLVRTMGKGPPLAGTQKATELEAVRRAVQRASARLPWRTVCFQEGLAAHWLLRRRGIDSRLHYGIRPEGDRLSAHVWVEADGAVVIGEEERGQPHVRVAIFPPEVPPTTL